MPSDLKYPVEILVNQDTPQGIIWTIDALYSVGMLDKFAQTAVEAFLGTPEGEAYCRTLLYQGGGITVASDGYHDDD